MLDRVKFWWSSLSRGVGQLYNAAGWLGLVVPILGVAGGIAVPLVFNLTPWLTAVVLMGLFIVTVLEGAYRVWHATEQQWEDSRREIECRFAAMRYALQISDIESNNFLTGPDAMGIQIKLKIKNNADEYMRYEIESFSLVIEGKTSSSGQILNTSAIIPPHDTNTFTSPAVYGVPHTWQMMGSMSLSIRYGHASGGPHYRKQSEYAVQVIWQLGSSQSQMNIVPVNSSEVEDI